MHLTIAAQKAILTNADSTLERKERALAELGGIPPKDPRYADAQQVLLTVAVPETANVDLDRLCQLYDTAHDEGKTAEQRQKAAELLAAIDADKVVAKFLALPANLWEEDGKHPRRGQPKYQNFDELATWLLGWLVWSPGESNEAIHTREDRLRADKLGIVVRAQRLDAARARRRCDCDYTIILGDSYHLAVHWCAGGQPHSPKEITVRQAQP